MQLLLVTTLRLQLLWFALFMLVFLRCSRLYFFFSLFYFISFIFIFIPLSTHIVYTHFFGTSSYETMFLSSKMYRLCAWGNVSQGALINACFLSLPLSLPPLSHSPSPPPSLYLRGKSIFFVKFLNKFYCCGMFPDSSSKDQKPSPSIFLTNLLVYSPSISIDCSTSVLFCFQKTIT